MERFLIKGENVMIGYWNNNIDQQIKLLKMDGYIQETLGILIDGFKITGRKKIL